MSANQAKFPVTTMARVLSVSKAGFYAWLQRSVSAHAQAATALLKRVRTVHAISRETYGAPRINAELQAGGEKHGRKRIVRPLRDAGLVGASRRRHGPTTTRRDKEARPAPDLVDRDFTAAGPNQLWVSDITFEPTSAGFMYLAVVLDASSRKIVGWSMAAMAWAMRSPLLCRVMIRRWAAMRSQGRGSCPISRGARRPMTSHKPMLPGLSLNSDQPTMPRSVVI